MKPDGSARFATWRPAAVGAACAAALMAGAVGGVWAAGLALRDERVEPAATRVVRAGTARIEVPRTWETVRTTPKTVVLAPAPPLRDRVIIAAGPADDASLVPASLRARTQDLGGGPRAIELAGRPAWRYPGLLGRGGDETLDVTVLPGRDAVLSVACVASVRDALAAPDCASAISSVSLGGARTLVPAPDLGLRLMLPRVLQSLDRTRVEARAALGTADTAATQARWARRLASAHAGAAAALQPVASVSGAPLTEALSASARAYRELARTASAPSASRFRDAQREVRASDTRLAGAVDAVARRPVAIAAAPARSPQPQVNQASTPGWLLPVLVLSALLVGVLVTLVLRRPRPGPARRPSVRVAPPERAAAPERAAPARERPRPTPGRWDAPPTPPDGPRRSGGGALGPGEPPERVVELSHRRHGLG